MSSSAGSRGFLRAAMLTKKLSSTWSKHAAQSTKAQPFNRRPAPQHHMAQSQRIAIPGRDDLTDISATPGGTIWGTTPGGTRIGTFCCYLSGFGARLDIASHHCAYRGLYSVVLSEEIVPLAGMCSYVPLQRTTEMRCSSCAIALMRGRLLQACMPLQALPLASPQKNLPSRSLRQRPRRRTMTPCSRWTLDVLRQLSVFCSPVVHISSTTCRSALHL